MPWTCLHKDWLEDYEFTSLSLTNRGVLLCLHMLAARSANRIPLDHRWISHKIAAPPQVVGKAIATLLRVGLVEEFVEDAKTQKNKDLAQILGVEDAPSKGQGEKYLNIEGTPDPNERRKSIKAGSSKENKRGTQPNFELLTRACMDAGVRGSDHHRIAEVVRSAFNFEPSENQLAEIERQLIDRRKE